MSQSKKPFYREKYALCNGCLDPIVEIKLGKEKRKIKAYVDTGCSTGIFAFKEQVKDLDLGAQINDEPSPCIFADGRRIGANEYVTQISINEEERIIQITVLDPTIDMGKEEVGAMTPLLGRNFIDHYDVSFKGKEKVIEFFVPE